MEVKGDLLSNSTFFKDQWENYKVTTGLREKSKNVQFASFRSVIGRLAPSLCIYYCIYLLLYSSLYFIDLLQVFVFISISNYNS